MLLVEASTAAMLFFKFSTQLHLITAQNNEPSIAEISILFLKNLSTDGK